MTGDCMRKVSLWIPVFMLFLAVGSVCSAGEDEDCGDPCGKATPWNDFNVVELKMTVPNALEYAIWNSQIDTETHDIQVDVETSNGKEQKKGKILMVGGRVMATQGPITEPGYEIDALDAAILHQILVVRLLGASIPNGPTENGSQKVDFSNEKTGIQFATPSAQGFIAPPWKVKGDVRVFAGDGVEYSLALT